MTEEARRRRMCATRWKFGQGRKREKTLKGRGNSKHVKSRSTADAGFFFFTTRRLKSSSDGSASSADILEMLRECEQTEGSAAKMENTRIGGLSSLQLLTDFISHRPTLSDWWIKLKIQRERWQPDCILDEVMLSADKSAAGELCQGFVFFFWFCFWTVHSQTQLFVQMKKLIEKIVLPNPQICLRLVLFLYSCWAAWEFRHVKKKKRKKKIDGGMF